MTSKTNLKAEGGFTLVELAIVLMIIGLLIGGILRGQELMENARVTSTVQQTKAYDGAVTTFRDAYSALPGDIQNAGTRLANCIGRCAATGADGNGIIGAPISSPTGTLLTPTAASPTENDNFWTHLGAVHLLSGVDSSDAATITWGSKFPAAKIAGGFRITHVATATGVTPQLSGPFLFLLNSPTATSSAGATGVNAISPLRAAQIDRKLDDGLPQSGDVIGAGVATNCTGLAYMETVELKDCNLLIRVQN